MVTNKEVPRLAELMTGGDTFVDPAPFDPARF